MTYLTDPTTFRTPVEYLPNGVWVVLAAWGAAWYFIGSAFRVVLG